MSDSEATRQLQEAIKALAAEAAPAVIADARSEAEASARALLAQQLTRALLREAESIISPRRDSPEPFPEVALKASAGESAPPLPSGQARRSALGLYLYGIVRASVRITGDLPGVDRDQRVFLLEGNELAAIVSSVSLEEFGEEQLRENLNEVAWLEDKARAHESVLEDLIASATVVPTRLCTIFRDEKQVREMMAREGPALVEALDRLEGKSEWGVKVFAEPGALERAAVERAKEGSGKSPCHPAPPIWTAGAGRPGRERTRRKSPMAGRSRSTSDSKSAPRRRC